MNSPQVLMEGASPPTRNGKSVVASRGAAGRFDVFFWVLERGGRPSITEEISGQ